MRSGTTLLKALLAEAPDISHLPEVNYIPQKYRTKENYDYLVYLTKRYFRYLKHDDQSVINMWMWKNAISPTNKIEYNYQVRFFKMSDKKMPISDIYILHFLGMKINQTQNGLETNMIKR